MTDRFRARLSEYVDGDLASSEEALVERHLETCDECADVLADLEAVRTRAAELTDRVPETDLWAGIEARITTAPGVVESAGTTTVRRLSRRISFTVPQLAAAAVALASISVAGAWMTLNDAGADGENVAVQDAQVADAAFVSNTDDAGAPLTERYGSVIAELESALFQSDLNPETENSLRRALLKIDRAIEDAERALEELPGDPYLEQHVENTMRRKTDFLRRAVRMSQS